MYQLNRPYTKKELAELVFHISYNTLKANPDMYMNHLKEYFEIREVPAGRHPKYMLVKEIKPWETYAERNKRECHEIIEDYRDAADTVIQKDPRQTKTSVANAIDLYNINNIHKYFHAKDTIRRNTGKAMEQYYRKTSGKWCEKLDGSYRVMTEDERDLLKGLQQEFYSRSFKKENAEKRFKILNQLNNNEISDKEAVEEIKKIDGTWYEDVIKEFRKVYGFTPVYTYEWERNEEEW